MVRVGGFTKSGLVAAALATALVAGCSRERDVRISVVLPATGVEFSEELRLGAEAAARDLGEGIRIKIVGPAQIDPPAQIRDFQNEVATAPDGIVVGAIPPSLFVEPALQAQRAGIKVAWIVSPPPAEVTEALFVGQREYDMGRTIGNHLADRITARRGADTTGTIVLGTCVPGMINLEDRMLGLRQALNERLPNVQVPPTIADGNERAANFATWQQAVTANPNALAFAAACEPGMINLAQIKEDDRRDFELAVFDTPRQVRESIKQGTISAAAPPSHFISAYMAVYTLGMALKNGQDPPNGWISTPIRLIDSSNIDAFQEAYASPDGLENFFREARDEVKAAAASGQLPPVSAARP